MNDKKSKKEQKTSFCPVAGKCGGCQLQNMTYERQLGFKEAKVVKLLGKYCHVDNIIGMEHPFHYRNKVQAAFGSTRGGKIISGVYQSKSHRIVCIDRCRIEDRKADEIIVTIRSMMPKYRMTAYNEDRGTGFLRHVLVKRGFKSGEIMVVLVTGTVVFPGKNAFIKELLEIHPEITTIVQNINNSDTSMVLGETEKVLYGKGHIKDSLCGCVFGISPKSFYQINPIQTEKLYNKAMEFANLTGKETVIDAYCGIGTIGIVAAKKAKQVIGVEVNRDAVHDAIANAKLNDTKNIRFYCADAGEFMVDMASNGEKADIVFMDPPRAGSDKTFLSSVVTLSPKKIVYISCNPETQARDLSFLVRNGYKVRKIQPVDMFPHTAHVETVCLLGREIVNDKNVEYAHVDYEPKDAEYLKSAKGSASYREIKEWIKEQHDVSVSNLYIAQVKDKLGFEKRENYNKGVDGHRVPNCPAEKEKLILEAFKHFKMIQQK